MQGVVETRSIRNWRWKEVCHSNADQHLIAITSLPQSGLEPRWWIEKLVSVCSREGRIHGPVFADASGVLALSPDYNSTFQGYLYRLQSETTLIDKDVDVLKVYNTYHTLRKTG